MDTTLSKVSILQNGLRVSFTFLWLLPNIEQNRIPLNDNIVWSKNSSVIKDLSKSCNFFMLNVTKYLGTKLFYSLYVQTYIFFEKYAFQSH